MRERSEDFLLLVMFLACCFSWPPSEWKSEVDRGSSRTPRYQRDSGKEKAHDFPSGGGSRPGGQGSNVYVLCAEPKEHKHIRPGNRPGGSLTG